MKDRLINVATEASPILLLAHGAGAGMDSHFLEYYTQGMVRKGVTVIRFCFPYMHTIRKTQKRRPPDRWEVLQESFRKEIDRLEGEAVIAGKSMGGRVASTILSHKNIKGGICLGYPFHPPKKNNKLRIAHLGTIKKEMLIIQGSRDPFGTKGESLSQYLSESTQMRWLEDGNHDFVPRKSSGHTWEQHMNQAIEWSAAFIHQLFL